MLPLMRISLNGSAETAVGPSIAKVAASIDRTSAAGLGGYWLAQTGLSDALGFFIAAAENIGDMEVGTAVIPTFTQHPIALAAHALTCQAAIGGRLVLGIGLSHQPAVEDRLGMQWDRPIRHLREYLDILLPLLEAGKVSSKGDIWTANDIVMERPYDGPPPSVMIAALGPQALDVCGKRTDGTILWLVGPKTIREHIAPRINEAAASASRPAPRVMCSLPICVTDDEPAARALVGSILAGYNDLPSYKAMLDREGVEGPADVAIIGDEASVAAQLDNLADAGATEFAALPLTFDPELMDRTWAFLQGRAG